jgi:hypothetical protein
MAILVSDDRRTAHDVRALILQSCALYNRIFSVHTTKGLFRTRRAECIALHALARYHRRLQTFRGQTI